MEAIVDSLGRFFRWLSGSWLRVAAVAVVSVPVLLFVALIIGPIRRRVFPWLGMAIGVLLVTLAYYLLVPTSLDKTLSLAFLMLLTAAFFLWKFAPVRNTIFGLLVLFTLIFFLGGRTAAKDAAKAVWTSAGTKSSSDTTATTDTQRQAPPKSKGQPADASGESTDKSEKKTLPDSPAQPAQSAPAPAPLATIYPLSGEKGNLVPIMHDCYYASADVVTCEGSVVNMDGDRIKHGVYLMDSQGIRQHPGWPRRAIFRLDIRGLSPIFRRDGLCPGDSRDVEPVRVLLQGEHGPSRTRWNHAHPEIGG